MLNTHRPGNIRKIGPVHFCVRISLVLRAVLADKTFIMISYVDHQIYIGEQADAESPPDYITAVLWTAGDIQIAPPPNSVFARLPLKEFTEPDPIDIEIGISWIARHLPEHHILMC